MAKIETVEIVVNGKRKIVNADDPRAAAQPVAVKKPQRATKARASK